MRRFAFVVLLIGSIFLSACNVLATPIPPTITPTVAPPATGTNTPAPTGTVAPSDTPAATDTAAPSATTASSDTPAPSDTPVPPTAAVTTAPTTGSASATPAAPTQTQAAGPTPGGSQPAYIDNRSSATDLMTSFVSALNLHQYVRAYSYWTPGAPQLQPFAQFQAGYANTQSVQLTLGTITSSGAAGHAYFSTPATLVSQTAGGTQTFVGCYIIDLVQPANFGAPPIQPMSIDQAQVQQVANNANTASLMAQVCSSFPGAPLPATPVPDPNDISSARYLDDRSDAVQVIRSLFNAVNRKEYVRAYSYWEPNAQGLPPYNQFQQGYASTASVTLAFGTVKSDAGAGQFYYSVPTTLVAKSTANATQTFVACYVVHLSSPDAQGVPPFRPMGIRSATVKTVANNADTASLMAQACP
jgi:hypothetical protein